MIHFEKSTQTFYLETEHTSYIILVLKNGILSHRYYGTKIACDTMDFYHLNYCRVLSPYHGDDPDKISPDCVAQEYAFYGTGDFREPSVIAQTPDGRNLGFFVYASHRIFAGKSYIPGLPQLEPGKNEAETLEITLTDSVVGLDLVLSYTVFAKEDVIARHTTIINHSNEPIYLKRAASLCVDFENGSHEMLTLHGAWARERHIDRYPLHYGTSVISSSRTASSAQLSPFAAILSPDATETAGNVFGFTFVYSGDFRISAEVNQGASTRITVGLNPETFSWKLDIGESFVTPEAWMTFSDCGLIEMSHHFHDVCRNYLGRSADKNLHHPIIINSWEAMYFNLTEEKIIRFIKSCNGMGIDTFVLDDGWFGNRNDDSSSLGDWVVNTDKFPNGLHKIIETCRLNNMKFGIWFEPEMVCRNSKLFSEHSDYCIHAQNRVPCESRNQLVLDLSRNEVVDYVYDMMAKILDEYDISYIKWDMNRNITDNGSELLQPNCQGEHSHRYVLGLYQLMNRLIQNYPNVFFEGCSSGGARFDYGILYYMPQIWTSDDSDAVERLKIQYGTSIAFPPASMVGHVSACPNHQTGRITPFSTRGDVAQMCNFGYELDIESLSNEEKNQISVQTKKHREIEDMILSGSFYRLISPFDSDFCAWQFVSKDYKRSYVTVTIQRFTPNIEGFYLRLQGLVPNNTYYIEELNTTLHGSTLMYAGIPIYESLHDFKTITLTLSTK